MTDKWLTEKSRLGVCARPALTLLELVIVISIVLLLLAMLVPSLSHAREHMRRATCKSNLKQWGNAVQFYREDFFDYFPTEGNYRAIDQAGTWFNALPPYLNIPAYRDVERFDEQIKEFPDMHLWICPSKNLTGVFKSTSGKNQFHYGMNQILDGLGSKESPSKDTPGFPDRGDRPLRAHRFSKHPTTVLLFDIAPNSPAGTQRTVATEYYRDYKGDRLAKFHGDFANVLYLSGGVINCKADDLVRDRDFPRGDLVWDRSKLYWGWTPPHNADGT